MPCIMPPTVSIILTAKNSADYLNRCIDSVIAQQYRDWELLIINDSSTDSTSEIADDYAKSDPRISVYDSEGTGVSAARNTGLEKACGSYVSFIDSDILVNDPDRIGNYLILNPRTVNLVSKALSETYYFK